MKAIDLYGSQHGVHASDILGRYHYEVDPPPQLIEALSGSDVTSVGLEIAPAVVVDDEYPHRVSIDGQNLSGGHFFTTLEQVVAASDKQVHRLDDDELLRQQVKAAGEVARISDIDRRYSLEEKMLPRGAERQLEFEHIKGLRIIRILREVKLFEKIGETLPDAVVVGQAHAERLFNDTELQDSLGLVVKRYGLVLGPDVSGFYGDCFFQPQQSVLDSRFFSLPDRQPSSAVVKAQEQEAEQLERIYRSFQFGRVLDDDSPPPDFIGTFDCRVAELGLFELHVDAKDSDRFFGRMYDRYGDAVVTGELDEDGNVASFDKEYIAASSSEEAALGKLHYTVRRSNGSHYSMNYKGSHTMGGAYMIRPKTTAVKSLVEDCRTVLEHS